MTDVNPLTQDIVRRVSDVTGRDESELPPLYDVIDPDAVDAIGESSAAKLQFVYAGVTVTVEVRSPGDWRVTVQEQ